MKFEDVIRKIDRPPAAQNFSRLNEPGDVAKTADRIVSFALGMPAFNYEPSMKACRDKVQFNLAEETALLSVRRSGAPAGRESNASFVEAFYAYDDERGYSKAKLAPSYDGSYRISRSVRVPTRPSFTIYENGRHVPIILCGWKALSLSHEQMRLWLTLLESGLFSYGDYRHSPAEILIFPEQKIGKFSSRTPLRIGRGDYDLFSNSEMNEIASAFIAAQELAAPIAKAKWDERESKRPRPSPSTAQEGGYEEDHPDLFKS